VKVPALPAAAGHNRNRTNYAGQAVLYNQKNRHNLRKRHNRLKPRISNAISNADLLIQGATRRTLG
jgi:hypothetical protein